MCEDLVTRLRTVVLVGVIAMLSACAAVEPVSPVVPASPSLKWLAEFTRPAGFVYPTLSDSGRFGELSGLAADSTSGQWLAVIDDRDSRVAWLSIEFANGSLNVVPNRLMPLRASPGVADRVATRADLEAVVALPDGTFMMGEEGHAAEGEIWQPTILHVTREGLVTAAFDYPAPFQIQQDAMRGLRPNQGFESLARLPNGHLVAGLEQPLFEDGETSSFDRGGRGRLIEFVPADGGWRPGRQWTYQIDPTPRLSGFETLCENGGNGLVELLALTDTTLLSMERACVQNPQTKEVTNPIQIFVVELVGAEARKRLVLDLVALAKQLPRGLRHLDNFEAMAFGPRTPDGGSTLLIVSDDNFRSTQQTAFLLFEMK
jgi:hypothetical protein